MDLQRKLLRHRGNWKQLEELIELFDKSPGRVSAESIDRLTVLYKQASSHLAVMQTEDPGGELTAYLNQLVTRAHHMMYRQQHKSSGQLKQFFGTYFIRLIRERQWFIVAAALLFLFGGVSGFASVLLDEQNLYAILPQQIAGHIDPSQTGKGLEDAPHSVLSTQIMTNNIRVAILAFAGGITFGIWTVYLLAYNGILIGALAAVYWKAGQTYLFWAYILPHGVIELAAIFIAGGAGLYMGYRMFVPGRYVWRLQLLRSAKQSVQLLLGTVPLFVIAGIIEGYITPSALSLEMKYAFALLTLLALAAYYVYGRLKRNQIDSLDLSSR
ncbi:stage II sporulation protein M [Paenibacillus sp. GYB004]|uniref:stage II sporulation protein M n=1 Tax=Paenibacillus sp. GYB004 TaxID=2994393 RepID=UPI002F962129